VSEKKRLFVRTAESDMLEELIRRHDLFQVARNTEMYVAALRVLAQVLEGREALERSGFTFRFHQPIDDGA
jgi:hypothetical protein